jgi:hypothetical protein
MAMHLGDVPAGITLYIPFATYNASGESEMCSGLELADIKIYKNGSTTERSVTNGYTLLDTDGINFDGLQGINGFSVDLNDNTDAGFYSVGGQYWIVVASITADSFVLNFIAATFRIIAAETIVGKPQVDADAFAGSELAATNASKTTAVIGRGTATTGGTPTSIPTSAFVPNGVDADQFVGRVITFDADTTTTGLRGQSTRITACTAAANPTFTVIAMTRAPASGDTFSAT